MWMPYYTTVLFTFVTVVWAQKTKTKTELNENEPSGSDNIGQPRDAPFRDHIPRIKPARQLGASGPLQEHHEFDNFPKLETTTELITTKLTAKTESVEETLTKFIENEGTNINGHTTLVTEDTLPPEVTAADPFATTLSPSNIHEEKTDLNETSSESTHAIRTEPLSEERPETQTVVYLSESTAAINFDYSVTEKEANLSFESSTEQPKALTEFEPSTTVDKSNNEEIRATPEITHSIDFIPTHHLTKPTEEDRSSVAEGSPTDGSSFESVSTSPLAEATDVITEATVTVQEKEKVADGESPFVAPDSIFNQNEGASETEKNNEPILHTAATSESQNEETSKEEITPIPEFPRIEFTVVTTATIESATESSIKETSSEDSMISFSVGTPPTIIPEFVTVPPPRLPDTTEQTGKLTPQTEMAENIGYSTISESSEGSKEYLLTTELPAKSEIFETHSSEVTEKIETPLGEFIPHEENKSAIDDEVTQKPFIEDHSEFIYQQSKPEENIESVTDSAHRHSSLPIEEEHKIPFSFRITGIDFAKEFEDVNSGKFKKLRDQLMPDLEEIFGLIFADLYRRVSIERFSKGSVFVEGNVYTSSNPENMEQLATDFEQKVSDKGAQIGGNDVDLKSVSLNGFISNNYADPLHQGYTSRGTSAFIIVAGIVTGVIAILLVAFALIAMNNRRNNGRLKVKEENIAMAETGRTSWNNEPTNVNLMGYINGSHQIQPSHGQAPMVMIGSQMTPLNSHVNAALPRQ